MLLKFHSSKNCWIVEPHSEPFYNTIELWKNQLILTLSWYNCRPYIRPIAFYRPRWIHYTFVAFSHFTEYRMCILLSRYSHYTTTCNDLQQNVKRRIYFTCLNSSTASYIALFQSHYRYIVRASKLRMRYSWIHWIYLAILWIIDYLTHVF